MEAGTSLGSGGVLKTPKIGQRTVEIKGGACMPSGCRLRLSLSELPIGVQLVRRAMEESLLLQFGEVLEQALDWKQDAPLAREAS